MRPTGSAAQLEYRRQLGGKLLAQGKGVREVARLLAVAPSSVSRWQQALKRGGERALQAKPHAGPAPPALPAPEATAGRHTRGGAAGGGVRHRGVDLSPRSVGNRATVWRPLSSGPCLAVVARPGLASAEARASGPRAGRGDHCALAAAAVAAPKKKRGSIRLTSSSSTRVAFVCSLPGGAPGHRAARPLSISAGTGMPASPSVARSLARHSVSAWGSTSASTLTIFARRTYWPSCTCSTAKCAAHPRSELLSLPTYWPRANPIERAFGDVHDKCT